MNVSAEVSLYPLKQPGISEPIKKFIYIIESKGLPAEMGPMSSLVTGELGHIMGAIKEAFEKTAEDMECVLIIKISNACPASN